jgi:misacylated tRNA(Ala) deacylase
MMSDNICYRDAYARQTDASVVEVDPEAHAVLLDRTVFYPGGGGQPADTGVLSGDSGGSWHVVGAR